MALGFVPSKIHQGHMQGWEYKPVVAGTYTVGEALLWGTSDNANKLTVCTGASLPVYISMADVTVAVAGTEIPCIKVDPEALYDVPITTSVAAVTLGTKVQIASGGASINATTSSSPHVEIVDKNGVGGAANDIVTVRIS